MEKSFKYAMEIYTCLCKNNHSNPDDLKHFLDSKFECFSQNLVPSSFTSVDQRRTWSACVRVKTSVLDSEKMKKLEP